MTPEYAGIALSSLEMVGTLGVGGFGRVVLVSSTAWTAGQ